MKQFNIRVYGLLINEKNQILLSDECRNGYAFTKFPGGGLEFGEGFSEALRREFQEEIGINVEVGDLFYFNDFFQESAFNPHHQLISFYFLVQCNASSQIVANTHEFPLTNDGEKHRWVSISEISESQLTFPIDKLVTVQLKNIKKS